MLAYLTISTLPSTSANSVHSMRMAEAFRAAGSELIVHVESLAGNVGQIGSFYGIDVDFPIVNIPRGGLPFARGMQRGLAVARHAKRNGATLAFGRDIYACWGCALLGISTAYDSHFLAQPARVLQRFALRSLFHARTFRGVVVTSRSLKHGYESSYARWNPRILVAYNGANDHSGTGPVLKREKMRMQVGYIGQLYRGKGMELIDRIARRCPEILFHIVGGETRDLEEWKARTAGVENLRFHGFVPPERVGGYLASMDVLLAPYQLEVAVAGGNVESAQWMTPLKLFEAMGARKVVIASRLPVAEEVICAGVNGFLCSASDPEEWCGVLRLLAGNDNLRRSLSEAAYSDFAAHYSWRARAERVLQFVECR